MGSASCATRRLKAWPTETVAFLLVAGAEGHPARVAVVAVEAAAAATTAVEVEAEGE